MTIEIQTETWYILWGITITAIAGLVIALIKFRQKYIDAIGQLKERGKQSRQIGINEIKGGINEILGTFHILNEYDDVILLSTTKGNASLDLIGVNPNSLDLLENQIKEMQDKTNVVELKKLDLELLKQETKLKKWEAWTNVTASVKNASIWFSEIFER